MTDVLVSWNRLYQENEGTAVEWKSGHEKLYFSSKSLGTTKTATTNGRSVQSNKRCLDRSR
ncbi:hypothetical protein BT69DRAFT_1291394 [Atractiella rhizophila]|nr:hypothetical protein BT69DRAFT_1291394 [Atractiella rhizophila]